MECMNQSGNVNEMLKVRFFFVNSLKFRTFALLKQKEI